MTDDSKKESSIIPISSNNLVRVGSSIEITNKIIVEHEERLLQEKFPTVKIGNQEWMTKNLDVDSYANGDTIPLVQNQKEWWNLKTGAWCYYDNDPENGKIFGRLYNWYALNDPRGLAPKGWRIPSDDDWTILVDCLGGTIHAGTKMKNTSGWKSNGNRTNESGFSGLPGGHRGTYGVFDRIGYEGQWWSSSESGTGGAWYRYLAWYDSRMDRYIMYKKLGFSVRCLRD